MPYDEWPEPKPVPPELEAKAVRCPRCNMLFVFPCGVVRQESAAEAWQLIEGVMQRVPAEETWRTVELDFVCMNGHAFTIRFGALRGMAHTWMVIRPDLD